MFKETKHWNMNQETLTLFPALTSLAFMTFSESYIFPSLIFDICKMRKLDYIVSKFPFTCGIL